MNKLAAQDILLTPEKALIPQTWKRKTREADIGRHRPT
jgi:hypothetical protein